MVLNADIVELKLTRKLLQFSIISAISGHVKCAISKATKSTLMLKLALMFTTKHDKIICNQEQRAVFGHLSLLSTDILYFCLK